MKLVDEGKLYDTDTATLVAEWGNGYIAFDHGIRPKIWRLYRTPHTNYFAIESCSARIPCDEWEPIEKNALVGWLARNGGEDVILKHFPQQLERA